jgi:hypothetical protein
LVSGRSYFTGGGVSFASVGLGAAENLDPGAQSLDIGAQSLDSGAQSLDFGAQSLDAAPGSFDSENAGGESPGATDRASRGEEAVRADPRGHFPAPGGIA